MKGTVMDYLREVIRGPIMQCHPHVFFFFNYFFYSEKGIFGKVFEQRNDMV